MNYTMKIHEHSVNLAHHVANDPTVLYRAYDDLGCLLYVGVSRQLMSRLISHAASSFWFRHSVYIRAEQYPNRETALALEAQAILTEGPEYNDKIENYRYSFPAECADIKWLRRSRHIWGECEDPSQDFGNAEQIAARQALRQESEIASLQSAADALDFTAR